MTGAIFRLLLPDPAAADHLAGRRLCPAARQRATVDRVVFADAAAVPEGAQGILVGREKLHRSSYGPGTKAHIFLTFLQGSLFPPITFRTWASIYRVVDSNIPSGRLPGKGQGYGWREKGQAGLAVSELAWSVTDGNGGRRASGARLPR